MTGNSWARAAESKYEHRRRAREDRGAGRGRGPLPGPRRPPTPSSSTSSSASPASPTGAPRPPAAKSAREVESLCQGHPFPKLGPQSRDKHPCPLAVPPETPPPQGVRTTGQRPRDQWEDVAGFEEGDQLRAVVVRGSKVVANTSPSVGEETGALLPATQVSPAAHTEEAS
ncbi:atherin-like [Lepus europaeus]|uniref:atherin-like n=1 Tax=Lepus europaeus TaxID=9983 RepID=UPI002B46F03A|nr:atherin-like [Lepus europaeus]